MKIQTKNNQKKLNIRFINIICIIFIIYLLFSICNNKNTQKLNFENLERPFINLDFLIPKNKIKELNDKLINDMKDIKDTNFIAKDMIYGKKIQLTKLNLEMKKDDITHCETRRRRGVSLFHIPNENMKIFQYLYDIIQDINIFEDIGNIVIIKNNKNEKGIEHFDHNCKDWVSEFIWIRTNNDKLFYIKDKNNKIHYVDCNILWFDDMRIHNISPSKVDCFSIRIDGKFNNKFRNYLYNNAPFKNNVNREVFLKNKKFKIKNLK